MGEVRAGGVRTEEVLLEHSHLRLRAVAESVTIELNIHGDGSGADLQPQAICQRPVPRSSGQEVWQGVLV